MCARSTVASRRYVRQRKVPVWSGCCTNAVGRTGVVGGLTRSNQGRARARVRCPNTCLLAARASQCAMHALAAGVE